MKEIVKRLAKLPINIINRLVFFVYFSFEKYKSTKIKKLTIADSNILVLAPHQDDEVLGCGCLMQQALKNNCIVKTVFMTDGANSYSSTYGKQELVEIRRAEAIKVAEYYEMERPEFLDYEDGTLTVSDEAGRKLAEIINSFKPHYIFIPYFLDGHSDHTATSGIYLSSLKYVESVDNINTFAYEINSPMTIEGSTHYIDCTSYMRKKSNALKIYESQTMAFDSILLLNKLNKYLVGIKGEGIEFYKIIDIKKYKIAYDRFNNDNNIANRFRQMYSIYYMIPSYFKGMDLKKKIARIC